MATRGDVRAALYLRRLRSHMAGNSLALAELDGALAGSIDGDCPLDDTPRFMLAPVAIALYLSGVEASILRQVVYRAWREASGNFITASRNEGVHPRDIMRQCKFPLPDDTPDEITVWRGACGVSLDTARKGFSWSTRRTLACAYAVQMHKMLKYNPAKALLIKRTVKRAEVVFYVTGHMLAPSDPPPYDELIFDSSPAGDVDGDPLEWAASIRRQMDYDTDPFTDDRPVPWIDRAGAQPMPEEEVRTLLARHKPVPPGMLPGLNDFG